MSGVSQEIGGKPIIDLRSSEGNWIRFSSSLRMRRFFSEQNTQAMNGDIDSAEQVGQRPLWTQVRRRTRYIKLVGQSRSPWR